MHGARTIGAAAGAILLALSTVPQLGQAQALREITFVQPSPSAINSFPIYVAIGEGYFADEGLDVRVESVNGSAAVLQALSADQAQFGRPGPGPVLSARARGVDVVFLYNMMTKSSFGIVVQEDAPHQSVEDLKGTVIGVGTADGAEVSFARGVLTSVGMTEGADYEFLPIGDGGTAAAAFLRDEVSSYAASTADAAILNQRGLKLRDITPEEFVSFFGNGYVAMRSFIDGNPEVVEGFGRALVRAQVFAMDEANRAAVLEHLRAGMPQESEDPEFAEALFEAVLAKTIPLDRSNGWGYQDPAHWERWHQSLVETGDLEAPMEDLEAAYTNEFVAKWNEGVAP
ncbi:MAG: taurine transporter substrate binding subunit [Geminicoccaceae bacterium]|jgi:NitT/TauT family transport system substrate-binding protein|nr:taurine transporter substrate binding subunit [Geminicoccaceae bacterium]